MRALSEYNYLKHQRELCVPFFNNFNGLSQHVISLQNEKKLQLTQEETRKIQEGEEQHSEALAKWRKELNTRKQKLEAEFQRQAEEKAGFYRSDELLNHHVKYVTRSSVSVSANARSSVVDLQMEFVSGASLSIEGASGSVNGTDGQGDKQVVGGLEEVTSEET